MGVDRGLWVGVDGDPRGWGPVGRCGWGPPWAGVDDPPRCSGPQVDGRVFPVLPPTVSAAPTTRAHVDQPCVLSAGGPSDLSLLLPPAGHFMQ